MRKVMGAVGAAAFGLLLLAPSVFAGGPVAAGRSAGQASGDAAVAAMLSLTRQQVQEMRRDGQSLSQIALRQKVDPQRLVDVLVAQWTERIDARVQNGGLATAQAAALKTQLAARARDFVDRTAPGGMAGSAVGAGPRNTHAGTAAATRVGSRPSVTGVERGPRGTGSGTGICDGTGPHGPGRS
jgi:hypothetical protein